MGVALGGSVFVLGCGYRGYFLIWQELFLYLRGWAWGLGWEILGLVGDWAMREMRPLAVVGPSGVAGMMCIQDL